MFEERLKKDEIKNILEKNFQAAVMSRRIKEISKNTDEKKFGSLKIQEFFDKFVQSGSHDVNMFRFSLLNIFQREFIKKVIRGEKEAL